MKGFILCSVLVFIGSAGTRALAQVRDTVKGLWAAEIELRPRAEYRDNYLMTATDTILPAFHISQRNRIELHYRKRGLGFVASFQELHLWGESGVPSQVAHINAFECYLAFETAHKWSFKIGRQGVLLDNGRIFSDAPWAQQGRSHEGIRIGYKGNRAAQDVFGLFTRRYSDAFDEAYSPVAAHRYTWLWVHHMKYQLTAALTITSINAVDAFEGERGKSQFIRFTSGGRFEWARGKWYATICAYGQWGHSPTGAPILAYYVQPELKLALQHTTLRLGAEWLSGERGGSSANGLASFDVLYGVAWKFMGNMNLFTRFPRDTGGRGLVNPYLFIIQPLGKKLALRADFHLFFSQYPLRLAQAGPSDTFLGIENDLSARYKPANNLEINYGFSWLASGESMGLLNKVRDTNSAALWSYLMISYKFKLRKHDNL